MQNLNCSPNYYGLMLFPFFFYLAERTFEDDGKVLRVFEAFCSNTKSRHFSSGDHKILL